MATLTPEEAAALFDEAAVEADQITWGALAQAASQAIGPIQDAWPVASGRSAAGWRSIATAKGGSVVNAVAYTADVHGGLADSLVPSVLAQGEPRTIQDIEDPLTAILEGET